MTDAAPPNWGLVTVADGNATGTISNPNDGWVPCDPLTAFGKSGSRSGASFTLGTGGVHTFTANVVLVRGGSASATTQWINSPLNISINPNPVYVASGNAAQLTAIGEFTDGLAPMDNSTVTWSSNNTSVAAVYADGTAVGGVPGTATIRAQVSPTISALVPVNVTPPIVERVDVKPNPVNMSLSGHVQLTATLVYSDGTTDDATFSPDIIWSSADEHVATVDDGLVSPGASAADGDSVLITATWPEDLTYPAPGALTQPEVSGSATVNIVSP